MHATRSPAIAGRRNSAAKLDAQSTALYGTAKLWDDGLIDALVLDEADAADADAVAARGVRPVVTRTLMVDADARRRLARVVLEAGGC